MKSLTYWGLLLVAITACQSDEETGQSAPVGYHFQDGFEVSREELAELFPTDQSRWSTLQLVHPGQDENQVNLSSDLVRSGEYALRFLAYPSDAIVSKADIEKGGFAATAGSTITIEADLYINSTLNIKDLLLMDLECCACWDPSVPNNQCPGVRLMMSGEDDYLSMERGKILGKTIAQSTVPFPRQQWVSVMWRMQLSPDDDGMNQLFINDQEVIAASGMNLPNATLFREEAARQGIDFTLQEPLQYERVQVGATANGTQHPVEILVDNFSVRIE